MNEAAQRFDRALRRVELGDLSGALAEFRQAHMLAPNAVVVFNLGLLYAAMQRPVEAARALSDAMAAPSALTSEQTSQAQRMLAEQNERIGYVRIEVAAPQGAIEVDNVQVATLPLEAPLAIASGARVIGVLVPGHAPARKELIVAGNVQLSVSFDLVPIDGRLAHIELTSALPGADVFVDGQRVGRTPLESSITVVPGTRTVRLSRAGYRPVEQTLSLSDGARAHLTLTLDIDADTLVREGGELSLEPSEPLSVAIVDGIPTGVIRGPMRLPHGPHRVRVERGGFDATERDVMVPLGDRLHAPVALEPTPATRASYIENSRRKRRVRGAVLGLSGLSLAVGLTIALLAQRKLPAAKDELQEVERDAAWSQGGSCDGAGPVRGGQVVEYTSDIENECTARLNDASNELNRLEAMQIAGWTVAGASVAGALTAGIMLWRSDDPERYERRFRRIQPVIALSSLRALVSIRGEF
jgi:hypothetical protein